MKTDILTTEVIDKIAVVKLGSPKKMYFDMAMGDALTEELQAFAGDPHVRVVIITGGTPGYFNRHFDIPALIDIAEQIRASGRQWPDSATYHGGFFDKAMAICETMRLPRTVGMAAALWHILMGKPLSPREAEAKGFVHETVKGKAIDRAMEIAKHLSKHPPESTSYIKRLVRSANETPLADGLALERNLFLRLCTSDTALARMRNYEEKKITEPSRGFEVDEKVVNRG